MTLGKLLNISKLQFCHLQNAENVENRTYRISARIKWINKCKTNTFLPCMQYMLYGPFPVVIVVIIRIDFLFVWDCEVDSGENQKYHLFGNVPTFSYSSFVLITFSLNYYVSLGTDYHPWFSFLSVLRYSVHQHWILREWNWDWSIKGFFIF